MGILIYFFAKNHLFSLNLSFLQNFCMFSKRIYEDIQVLFTSWYIIFFNYKSYWFWWSPLLKKSRGDAETNFAIWDNWSKKKEYAGLSSQFLWEPSVGSTYPFPRVSHLILSSHTVNMDSLLCAQYCNRSWENKLHQSKSLLTKTIF